MRVSIHQPQYLPWVPYFTKMLKSDVFVFLDSVAFQKNGVQNRNQIKTASGAHWLTVPVKHHSGQLINETLISGKTDWRRKHLTSIQQNYGKTPFFKDHSTAILSIYETDWDNLSELNIALTRSLIKLLGIDVHCVRSSQLNLTGSGTALIRDICKYFKADMYISGVGGQNYLDESAFREVGIEVRYLPPILPREYEQNYPKLGFINHLSVIDILFNCGPSWRDFID